jgi:hypothetical protein
MKIEMRKSEKEINLNLVTFFRISRHCFKQKDARISTCAAILRTQAILKLFITVKGTGWVKA